MRVLNRVVAALVAVALAVAGVVVAVEVFVAQVLKREPWIVPYDRWYRSSQENTWSADVVLQIGLALIGIGLVLLLLQFLKRKPTSFPLETRQPGVDAYVGRRSLERSLTRAAEHVDGVSSAKAKVAGNRVRISASSNRRVAPDLESQVNEAVTSSLRRVHLVREPPVSVSVSRRDDS